ncbi:jg200, partial [Pararge aegeria aegeria]
RVAAARFSGRRARTMLASIKGFWKACRYGDLYM